VKKENDSGDKAKVENGKWLEIDLDVLYRLAVWVAQSKLRDKDLVLAAVRELLESHLRNA
jgi:hypothetical protein